MLQAEAVSVYGDVGEGKMMCTGDLVGGGGGGECPLLPVIVRPLLTAMLTVACAVPWTRGGGGVARRWCAHFNIHERSVRDVPVCPPPHARAPLGGCPH